MSKSEYPKLQKMKLSELNPAPYNPRKISSDALGRLTKSLSELGNLQPITWNAKTGNIVGGHQRLKCYQALQKEEVEVWAVWLDNRQEKAANIALNKLSGEFELPQLKDLIEEIDTGEIDLDVTGFGVDELAELMEQTKPEDEKEIEVSGGKCEACGRPL
jgi:ParB-like chromosome segregation protein Spo0J